MHLEFIIYPSNMTGDFNIVFLFFSSLPPTLLLSTVLVPGLAWFLSKCQIGPPSYRQMSKIMV